MQKFETLLKLNPHLLNSEYAIRGPLPQKAIAMKQGLLKREGPRAFDSLLECHLGNPMALGRKYLSFNRQVLDLVLNPWRAHPEKTSYHPDVVKMARSYLPKIGPSIGAYGHPKGFPWVRERVAQFCNRRDGLSLPVSMEDVLMGNGAAAPISSTLAILIENENSGILLPAPGFPLYSALLSLYNGKEIPYFLDEGKGWQMSEAELEKAHSSAVARGVCPRALVLVNPGNPTGQVLTKETIEMAIRFCYKKNLAILADEVYQETILKEGVEFTSVRKVLKGMEEPLANSVEVVSFHSASKGPAGECGLRSGYAQFENLPRDAIETIGNLNNYRTVSNTLGQVCFDLILNPPTVEGGYSAEIVEAHQAEQRELLESLRRRARTVTETLNSMVNVSSQEIEGALYAFPTVQLSKKAIEAAKAQGVAPDYFYCEKVLEETGIVLVPGSGFNQSEGTYHFRITILPPEEQLSSRLPSLVEFNRRFHGAQKA